MMSERPAGAEIPEFFRQYVARVPDGDIVETLDRASLARRGMANRLTVSVRAIAWVIAGHERHHRQVIRNRYLGAREARS